MDYKGWTKNVLVTFQYGPAVTKSLAGFIPLAMEAVVLERFAPST